jgi:GNAT superfamily N-acetyltransferase
VRCDFAAVVRWLGRVGVIRNDRGQILGALALQLPGDTAAYESLMFRSCSDSYDAMNPLDISSVSTASTGSGNDEAYLIHGRKHDSSADTKDEDLPSSLMSMISACRQMGLLNAVRFQYKHAIINDHVCPPGEAYVDFLVVKAEARREGVGKRLMAWAEQSAEKLGCGRIALSVWGLDKGTQWFYEALGKEQR